MQTVAERPISEILPDANVIKVDRIATKHRAIEAEFRGVEITACAIDAEFRGVEITACAIEAEFHGVEITLRAIADLFHLIEITLRVIADGFHGVEITLRGLEIIACGNKITPKQNWFAR